MLRRDYFSTQIFLEFSEFSKYAKQKIGICSKQELETQYQNVLDALTNAGHIEEVEKE